MGFENRERTFYQHLIGDAICMLREFSQDLWDGYLIAHWQKNTRDGPLRLTRALKRGAVKAPFSVYML